VEEPFQLDPRVGAEPAVAALIDHAWHDHRRPTSLTIQPLAPDLERMSLNPLVQDTTADKGSVSAVTP
jgi:hypothetical protein